MHSVRLRNNGLIAVLCGLLLATPALAQQRQALAPGDTAPDLIGEPYPRGPKFKVEWRENTLTLVNFWATWCVPCRDEMPLLEDLYTRMKDRGFTIVAPFERWERDRVGLFVDGVGGVSYVLLRPDATVDFYWGGVNIKPTSFLVNGSGRILRKYVGANEELTAGLVADVEALLSGKPMPPQVMSMDSVLPDEVEERLKSQQPRRPGRK